MVKVHILGAPGSRKTTLAQGLSSRLHIPHYDLDKVNWEQEDASALASQSAWVAEGIYLIEPMLYHADYIVWLEVSWPVAASRMIRRHILNSLHGTNPYPGINGVKALFNLLKYAHRYILNLDHSDRTSVEAFRTYLETHRDIVTQPTEDFLQAYFEVYQGPIVPPTAALTRTLLEGYKEKFFLIRNITDREHLLELLTQQ